MLSLEDYIAKRKREDKVNEFDVDSKANNLRICVNYVFEYFNQNLNIDQMAKLICRASEEEKYMIHYGV